MPETGSLELKARLDELEAESRELRAKVAGLERERALMLAHQTSVDALSTRFAVRFSAMEDELSMLANVYVASYQLSATFKLDRVLRHVHELLGQLIGSRAHAIFLVDDASRTLVCVASEGLASSPNATLDLALDPPGSFTAGGGFGAVIAGVLETGVSHFGERAPVSAGTEPTACIALRADERMVGVIVVHALLAQKPGLVPVDFELFKLLSAHAGTAIYGAALYESAGGAVPPPNALCFRRAAAAATAVTSATTQVDRNDR